MGGVKATDSTPQKRESLLKSGIKKLGLESKGSRPFIFWEVMNMIVMSNVIKDNPIFTKYSQIELPVTPSYRAVLL